MIDKMSKDEIIKKYKGKSWGEAMNEMSNEEKKEFFSDVKLKISEDFLKPDFSHTEKLMQKIFVERQFKLEQSELKEKSDRKLVIIELILGTIIGVAGLISGWLFWFWT